MRQGRVDKWALRPDGEHDDVGGVAWVEEQHGHGPAHHHIAARDATVDGHGREPNAQAASTTTSARAGGCGFRFLPLMDSGTWRVHLVIFVAPLSTPGMI
ncbi:MAG: hypothetical protein V3R87_00160 [Dehalococcoidia bacterium]